MDHSQLPNISGYLVTPDNPARDLPGMDYERCVALHNYLVLYAWLAQGRSAADLHANSTTFFSEYADAAEAVRPKLHPSLAAFFDAAIQPAGGDMEIFFWAGGFYGPDNLFDELIAATGDMPVESAVRLYSGGLPIQPGNGVFYLQGCHRAAVFMHLDDPEGSLPFEAHQELWHPLETILSNWIELIHLGKVVASPREEPALFGSEKNGPWEWRPYSDAQVITCVDAWDQLCNAIEARMPTSPPTTMTDAVDYNTNNNNLEPLATPAILNAASVPDPSFAHAFLTHARRPKFHYIAPGLLLPPTDTAWFVAAQPYTRLPRSSPHSIPPVCLFPAAPAQRPVNLTRTTSPFCDDFRATSIDSHIPSQVGAGVYSESVQRDWLDTAEEGFRLLLPFRFKKDDRGCPGTGARRSDGTFVGKYPPQDIGTALFQHGYKPFGGESYRAQRLERLFDCWRKLVENDVWSVGSQGVEGRIETFKDADGERWRDYYIPPTW